MSQNADKYAQSVGPDCRGLAPTNSERESGGAGESIQDAVRAAWHRLLHGGPIETGTDLGCPALDDPEQRLNYIAHLNGLATIHIKAADEIAEKIRRLDETLREDQRPYRFSPESALQHEYSRHAGALTALTSLVLDLAPPRYGETLEPRRTESVSPFLVEALNDVGSLTGATPLLIEAAIAAGWPVTQRSIHGAFHSPQWANTRDRVLEEHPWISAALATPRTRPATPVATSAPKAARQALRPSQDQNAPRPAAEERPNVPTRGSPEPGPESSPSR